jgi:hypothetical protein
VVTAQPADDVDALHAGQSQIEDHGPRREVGDGF